jgi:hypothetical protein
MTSQSNTATVDSESHSKTVAPGISAAANLGSEGVVGVLVVIAAAMIKTNNVATVYSTEELA